MANTPVSGDDDARLMQRLARGEREALAELVRRHQARVLELACRTLGDRELGQDIAQEAFLRVWRSAAQYEPRAQFTTWLYRIVVNLCFDARKKRRPILGERRLAEAEAGDHPAAAAERQDRAAAVQRAVDRLPERQRVAVVLHRFGGLSLREVAEATGWSPSAVESLLVRAYAELRKSLKNLME